MIPISSIAKQPMLDQIAAAAGNKIEQPQPAPVANHKVDLVDAPARQVQGVTSDAHAGAGGPGGLLDRTA